MRSSHRGSLAFLGVRRRGMRAIVLPTVCWLVVAAAAMGAETEQPKIKPVPPGGESLLGEDPMAALRLTGGPEVGKSTSVDVAGQAFTRAMRLETLQQPANPWNLQILGTTKSAVKKGDVLLASFYVRSLKGQPETGEARATFVFSTGGPNWSKSLSQGIAVPREWKRFDIPFVVRYETPAGQSQAGFFLGFSPQTLELAQFSVLNFGDRVKIGDLPRTAIYYTGQESNAPWRQEAAARIERIRKGDLKVVVQDAAGKPVEGAKVAVRMKRHAFAFGSAVGADFLLVNSPDAEQYRQHIKELYNRVVLENQLKWPNWETRTKDQATRGIQWLREQQIEVRGHTLVWPSWKHVPADLQKLRDDKPALAKRVEDHIAEETAAYRGQLVEWDVINEPYTNRDVWQILGREAMADWFRVAQRNDPVAKLFINDYPSLDGGATTDKHLNDYAETIEMLQAKGAPLQGIGFQCHLGATAIPPTRLLSGLDRFAKYGVPIAITEFDMDTPDEELQARYMRDFLTATFSHPAVNSVIMWGFWEGRHWLPNAALYRRDWSIKPNGQVWLDLVKKEWSTNADGNTDAKGAFGVRGFYGVYEITATTPQGKTKSLTATFADKNAGSVVLKLDP